MLAETTTQNRYQHERRQSCWLPTGVIAGFRMHQTFCLEHSNRKAGVVSVKLLVGQNELGTVMGKVVGVGIQGMSGVTGPL